jgi:hypothetical protein
VDGALDHEAKQKDLGRVFERLCSLSFPCTRSPDFFRHRSVHFGCACGAKPAVDHVRNYHRIVPHSDCLSGFTHLLSAAMTRS